MIFFLTNYLGVLSIETLRQRLNGEIGSRIRTLIYEEFHLQDSFEPGTYIFGNFSLLSGAQRKLAIHLANSLEESGDSHIVFNHPSRALNRGDLLTKMYEEGINDFRAYRVDDLPKSSIRFPVFVRHEHDHAASLTELLHTNKELDVAISKLTQRGWHKKDILIVIEFCNTIDESGLYRKYSAFKVGSSILPRCLNFSNKWDVKNNLRGYRYPNSLEPHAERIHEEIQYMKTNPHEAWVRLVFERAHIEYGRIDYALLDGKPQVWEINSDPKMGGGVKKKKRSTPDKAIREARSFTRNDFYTRMNPAMELIAGPENSADGLIIPIPVHLSSLLRRQRRHARRRLLVHRVVSMTRLNKHSGLLFRLRTVLGPYLRRY